MLNKAAVVKKSQIKMILYNNNNTIEYIKKGYL